MKFISCFLLVFLLFIGFLNFSAHDEKRVFVEYAKNLTKNFSLDQKFYRENLLTEVDEVNYIKRLHQEKLISESEVEFLLNKGVRTLTFAQKYYVRVPSGFDDVVYYDISAKCWIRRGKLKYLMFDTCFNADIVNTFPSFS